MSSVRVDDDNLLLLLKPRDLVHEKKTWQYRVRILKGLELIIKIIQDCEKNPSNYEKLYITLDKAIKDNPSIKELAKWETIGLKLCYHLPNFLIFFPVIQAERRRWSLLDYLQNEIIQFLHFSGKKTEEKYTTAKQAMNFLLSHRNSDQEILVTAIKENKILNQEILANFIHAIPLYHDLTEAVSSSPHRKKNMTLNSTAGISIIIKEEMSMITVGCKPDGASSGRLKVKRIRDTVGKSSETDKYLNLWLEKDIHDENKENKTITIDYTEPFAGSVAHALYPSGTPKARLLEKSDTIKHSSISKFQNNLILAQDILTHPDFKSTDQNKLLGLQVKGLVQLLVISSWLFKNEDLNLGNFGVVPEGINIRFFLFDFDNTAPWSERDEKELLNALDKGDMKAFKVILKSYIQKSIPEETELKSILKNVIHHSDDKVILQELKAIITDKAVFSNRDGEAKTFLLTDDTTEIVQRKLNKLKTSIETFVKLRSVSETDIDSSLIAEKEKPSLSTSELHSKDKEETSILTITLGPTS